MKIHHDPVLSAELVDPVLSLKYNHSICYAFGCRFVGGGLTLAELQTSLACSYPGGICQCPLNVVRGVKRQAGLFFVSQSDIAGSYKHLRVFKLVVDSLQPYSLEELAQMSEPDATLLVYTNYGGLAPESLLKIVFAKDIEFGKQQIAIELDLLGIVYFTEDYGVTISLASLDTRSFPEYIAGWFEQNQLKVERLRLDQIDEYSEREIVASFDYGDDGVNWPHSKTEVHDGDN